MASDGKHNEPHRNAGTHPSGRGAQARHAPEWADGLKQLYDAVVEEQLPDQFLDLLAQLDEQDGQSLGQEAQAPHKGGTR